MAAYGDAEAAVAAIVRANAAVVALGSVTVATDMVGYVKGARWVRVWRTGGVPTQWSRMDNPIIDFECYAATKGAAFALSSAARTAMYAARGVYTGHGLALYDVSDNKGASWEPDPATGTPRYTFTLALVCPPHA